MILLAKQLYNSQWFRFFYFNWLRFIFIIFLSLIIIHPENTTEISKEKEKPKIFVSENGVFKENGEKLEITSNYGYRKDPFRFKYKNKKFGLGGNTKQKHFGIDYAVAMDTEIYVDFPNAVVIYGNELGNYGNLIILFWEGKLIFFAHLSKILVYTNQILDKPTCIAYSGNSGKSSGPHTHFEIRTLKKNLNYLTEPINPKDFIKEDSEIFF